MRWECPVFFWKSARAMKGQFMYMKKAGFVKNGLRKNYYEDPVEHAVLMMHETVGKER